MHPAAVAVWVKNTSQPGILEKRLVVLVPGVSVEWKAPEIVE